MMTGRSREQKRKGGVPKREAKRKKMKEQTVELKQGQQAIFA